MHTRYRMCVPVMELVYFRNEKNDLFLFPLPYPYNSRICITDADTEKSDVETAVIFRILFRICSHKST